MASAQNVQAAHLLMSVEPATRHQVKVTAVGVAQKYPSDDNVLC